MAQSSSMMPLGTRAPEFNLRDAITDKMCDLNAIQSSKATVIMFICNHCPYVKHLQNALVQIAKDYQPKGVVFVAISSNDEKAYPDDSVENMKKVALQLGYPFPYLVDDTQDIARAYNAVCTPDFFLFDKDMLCVYRGQFDDSRPGNSIPVTGKDLRLALDQLLAGKPISSEQKPSIGCSIKWK